MLKEAKRQIQDFDGSQDEVEKRMEAWLKAVTYYYDRIGEEMQTDLMQYICYVKLRNIEMEQVPSSLQELH